MIPFLPLSGTVGGIRMTGVCCPIGICTWIEQSWSPCTAVSLKDSWVNFRPGAQGLQAKLITREPPSSTQSMGPSISPTLPMHLIHQALFDEAAKTDHEGLKGFQLANVGLP